MEEAVQRQGVRRVREGRREILWGGGHRVIARAGVGDKGWKRNVVAEGILNGL